MQAAPPFPTFTNAVLGIVPEPGRLNELHLYHGARCNRACAFCCVHGGPDGAHIPFSDETLAAAVRLTARRGSLKIYGGEPTLDHAGLRRAIARLRTLGFEGAITLFSNGLRPAVLLDLLARDPGVRVVLNRAIVTGEGERPLPRTALARLLAYHAANPDRLFLSHDFVVPIGRFAPHDEAPPLAPQGCYRCHPVLTGDGRLHACPFAVEYDRPHYRLGDTATPADRAVARYEQFLCWVGARLEPEAARQRRHVCAVCVGDEAPSFDTVAGDALPFDTLDDGGLRPDAEGMRRDQDHHTIPPSGRRP